MSSAEGADQQVPVPMDQPVPPRTRLAAALRQMNEAVVAARADDALLLRAAETTEDLVAEFGPALREGRFARPQPDLSRGAHELFPTSPVIGAMNPLSPPVVIETVLFSGGATLPGSDGVLFIDGAAPPMDSAVLPGDGSVPGGGVPDGAVPAGGALSEIRGRANFGFRYEGPPTCVHGGVIAEIFDEVMGMANLAASRGGMTGTLTVRYRKPTPLLTDLVVVARCLGQEGRKIRTWAALYHDEVLTAEAEAVFIELPQERFVAIAEANQGGADWDGGADAGREGGADDGREVVTS